MSLVTKKKVIVGISGGVDSGVAALLLKEQGYEVIGATLRLVPENGAQNQINDALKVSDALGIPLKVFDLRELFAQKVIAYFMDEYLNGLTPNPCTVCNPIIKFGALLDLALNEGAEYIATGHYAKIEKSAKRWLLKKANSEKDQSYFLYALNQHQLSHALFPLAGLEKVKTRELAQKYNLPVAQKPDSQEVCFIPDNNYADFIQKNCNRISQPGDFVDTQGKILGRHKGIMYYTIGQRKGLGAFGSPKYVVRINPKDNTVTLGDEGTQYSREFVAEDMNWIAFETIDHSIKADIKIRCRAKPAPATVLPLEDGKVHVLFDEPQRSITPGQAAVMYDGDVVLGGGRIVY